VEAYLPRGKRWINQSYLGLCEIYPWPFLEKTATGSAPVEIPDARAVLSVNAEDATGLVYLDRRTLIDKVSDLDLPGSPAWYYLEGYDPLTVNAYPAGPVTLDVRYLFVPPVLVNPQDRPIFPERFQELIVDGAVLKGYRDLDNWEAYQGMRGEHDRELQEMAASLMVLNHSEPTSMVYSHID
jgi:hypothetical protein